MVLGVASSHSQSGPSKIAPQDVAGRRSFTQHAFGSAAEELSGWRDSQRLQIRNVCAAWSHFQLNSQSEQRKQAAHVTPGWMDGWRQCWGSLHMSALVRIDGAS